jgi:hypothetical protein
VKERNQHAPRARTEVLAWLLDDADARDSDAVLAEMPRPAWMVDRRILKPRHDTQQRCQI